jgi:hypothetical protein
MTTLTERARDRAAHLVRRLLSRRASRPTMSIAATWQPVMRMRYQEAPAGMLDAFMAAGHRENHFFPHRVHRIPKCGPDGFRLARDMCGVRDVSELWQIVVFATPPAIDEFPAAMFFDRDLLWHEQHFGRIGQVASVDLVAHRGVLYTMAHQSDLVQRISRRRDLKTRVEKVFKGWHHLLLNAIAGFAAEHGLREIRVPTAALAMKHTDPNRTVQPELFERVYDRAVQHLFRARPRHGWWRIPVAGNRSRIVPLTRREENVEPGRTICITHDTERGHGHRDVDAEFARRADAESPEALEQMLAIEERVGIRATYHVVGSFLMEVRARIESAGHALAFHSYDHGPAEAQLARCRKVDYRIKGYRPPRSRLTPELRDERIHLHNVEWLAASTTPLGVTEPAVADRLARIPIAFDDFPLHTAAKTYEEWRRMAVDAIATRDFVAFGLHDCYGPHWLPDYERFLREVTAVATPRTMDEVASLLYLAAGE